RTKCREECVDVVLCSRFGKVCQTICDVSNRIHAFDEGAEFEGLDQVVNDPQLERRLHCLDVVGSGDHDDGWRGGAREKLLDDGEAVTVWQIDVHQQNVGCERLAESESLRSSVCLAHHSEPVDALDIANVHGCDTKVVIDHEYRQLLVVHRAPWGMSPPEAGAVA